MKNKNKIYSWKAHHSVNPAYPISALLIVCAVNISLSLAIPPIAKAMAKANVDEGYQALAAMADSCGLDSVVCLGEGRLPVAATTTNPVQIIRYLAEKNGIDGYKLLRLLDCESQLRPDVRGIIDLRDRGIAQINSYWHPEVSDECAFSVWCSVDWTIQMIKQKKAWQWVCNQRLQLF